MLLTPVSSGGSGPASPATSAPVPTTQAGLPPTPPPRRRTLLLGKGMPSRSSVEVKPPLQSHVEGAENNAGGEGQPGSPRSVASRLSLASVHSQQSPTSYEPPATRLSQTPAQSSRPTSQTPTPQSSTPAQQPQPSVTANSAAQSSTQPDQESVRWSRPPRSQARKVSKTMQIARETEGTAPLRPGSSASQASAASVTSAHSVSGPNGNGPGHSPRSAYSPNSPDSQQSPLHSQPSARQTHSRTGSKSTKEASGSSGEPSFEEQDDAWAEQVRAQLLRLFPDLGAVLPDRSAPVAGLRDEMSALRSEIWALRGVVGELRSGAGLGGVGGMGGTPPLATRQAHRANSVPVGGVGLRETPAKSRSLGLDKDTSFESESQYSDDSHDHASDPSHTSKLKSGENGAIGTHGPSGGNAGPNGTHAQPSSDLLAPRRPPLAPRDRLSLYRPSQDPEIHPDGLIIFATDSDARITLPPSAISLMLDVVRTVDMRLNGVRSDAEIFEEENLANLAISQVMN